ncbi:uncharacterized protein LOC120291093 [Eucalyptus grandis]|uniref:uncharacterized protein LOC120291093 n=1 Tax=Eucalyptus grandis TaxID=71139 RepID=UPI00192ED9F1|nr:uncharacterized protein LOC120291093 [Eucalyptus grandis]
MSSFFHGPGPEELECASSLQSQRRSLARVQNSRYVLPEGVPHELQVDLGFPTELELPPVPLKTPPLLSQVHPPYNLGDPCICTPLLLYFVDFRWSLFPRQFAQRKRRLYLPSALEEAVVAIDRGRRSNRNKLRPF